MACWALATITAGNACGDGVIVTEQVTPRHVSAALLAWWLDPQHQPEPPEVTFSNINSGLIEGELARREKQTKLPEPNRGYDSLSPFTTPNTVFDSRSGSTFVKEIPGFNQLPAGITKLAVVYGANERTPAALEIAGTAPAVGELKKLVALIDKPMPRYEVTVSILEVGINTTRQLGIDFSSNNGPFVTSLTGRAPAQQRQYALGRTRGDRLEKLKLLVKQQKLRVLAMQRLECTDGFTSAATSTTSLPPHPASLLRWEGCTMTTTCAPTACDDKSITLALGLNVKMPRFFFSGGAYNSGPPPLLPNMTLQTIENVRHDESIVFGGWGRGDFDILFLVSPLLLDPPTTP